MYGFILYKKRKGNPFIMTWILYAILTIISMIVAYITNPIVVLFADEKGNLPHCLRWWQTYDNCLDVGWMISEGHVPKLFRYDFDKHYVYHLEDKSYGLKPGYVDILDPNFTTKEKIQRYFCRLAWLYRNTAYGFAYEVLGREYTPKENVVLKKYGGGIDAEWISYIDDNHETIDKTWSFYLTKPWCKYFYLRIYAGWKLKGCTNGPRSKAMVACHFNPFRLR